jgi:recombination protein RecA
MTGLFVNQWRNKVGVMFGDPRTTPGGLQKNFYFWARLEVVREEMLIERDKNGNGRGALGQRIQINTFKNKQAPPRDAGSADYYFRPKYEDSRLVLPGDYDLGRELLNLGLVFDVVTKNGSMYAYGNASWRGEYAFSQAVMAEPALYAAIESDIRADAARRELPVAEQPEPRRRRMRSVS